MKKTLNGFLARIVFIILLLLFVISNIESIIDAVAEAALSIAGGILGLIIDGGKSLYANNPTLFWILLIVIILASGNSKEKEK